MPIGLTLSETSRFKKTALYAKAGKTFFGIWQPPKIAPTGQEKIVRIAQNQAGQLDLLAHVEYGDSSLWWCIALANNIMNLAEEVVVGKELVIPTLESIRLALLETE